MNRNSEIPRAMRLGKSAYRGIPFGAKFAHVMLPKL